MSIRYFTFSLFWLLASIFPVLLMAQNSSLRPPRGLIAEHIHQREIELKWNPTLIEGIEWEVQVNDRPPIRTKELQFTIANLDPATRYDVKVRMVRGTDFSLPAELQVQTKALDRTVDDPDRIPYLRTVRIDGSTKRRLPLYFTDLATSNARIVYRLEGRTVVPDSDNTLTIEAQTSPCRLDVDIEEDADHHFYLTYYLLIQ